MFDLGLRANRPKEVIELLIGALRAQRSRPHLISRERISAAAPELAWWNALNDHIPGRSITFQKRDRDAPQSDTVYSSGDRLSIKSPNSRLGVQPPSERPQLNRERERLLQRSE